MPEKTQHWTESLFDSVYALYEAAREYQIAGRAAQAAVDSVDFDRRKFHEGRVAIEGRTATRDVHGHALMQLHRVYGVAASEARRRYQEATLLYASGAAWAVRSVKNGDTPAYVTFEADLWGDPVPGTFYTPDLDQYPGAASLNAAYDAVRRCLDAEEHIEEMADWGPISEHDAGEMTRAGEVAGGLAAAAYAYGLLAQRALNFVLLEPRRARETKLALARTTAQTDQAVEPSA